MADFDPYPLFLLALGVCVIFFLILRWKTHAFLALIAAALLIGFLSPQIVLQPMDAEPGRQLDFLAVPRLVAQSFGSLMGRIGLVIAFATIVGAGLMESGGADRIVRAFSRLFGEKYGGATLLVSGFVLGIPVFFDTVFFLLAPLAKAFRIRTGRDYLLYLTAVGAGGAITHSLVPPTPGPIAMAANLNVDLGWTIIAGILVGAPLALVGYAWAAIANRVWPVELRQVGAVTLEELERSARKPDHELPGLFASMLPILLPVVLITSATLFGAAVKIRPDLNSGIVVAGTLITPGALLSFLGQPDMALLFSAVVAMRLVARQQKMSFQQLGRFTAAALDEAGMILLITCAGGAFGSMLQRVGVGESLRVLSNAYSIHPLLLGWGIAMLFKIAQGSGTVSMIAASEILRDVVARDAADAGLPVPEYLGFNPVYLVMAVGAGSKIGSWMNDSGFWVVCKMGGLTEGETFKSWTLCLAAMGFAGLPLIWLLTIAFPLL